MKLSHTAAATSVAFDDGNLIGYAGLVPMVRLAESCGLPGLGRAHLDLGVVPNSAGANPVAKVMSVVSGMCTGADSIDDLDVLRHGAMGELFDDVRAPSTIGSFLRMFTHGHNRQLHKVHRRFLAELAARSNLLPGSDTLAYPDIDPSHLRVYGHAKEGAEHGRLKGQRTLHPILSAISTEGAAPVIGAVRLRRGKSADVRGAESFVRESMGTARDAGCTGTMIMRADSKFYTGRVVAACRKAGTHFSITTGSNPSIRKRIAEIPEGGRIPIQYPHAIEDPDTGELISDAEIAEIEYTAFASDKDHRITARLVVRRVRDKNQPEGQDEPFPVWRYHAVFTDSPFELVRAEADHRRHAVIEQVIKDGKSSALAHMPSGRFQANNSWLILAAMAHNLMRAAGVLAGGSLAVAETATLRARLVQIPARIARGSRRITLHLPTRWRWETEWQRLFDATHGPPRAATSR